MTGEKRTENSETQAILELLTPMFNDSGLEEECLSHVSVAEQPPRDPDIQMDQTRKVFSAFQGTKTPRRQLIAFLESAL
jgi:hypothetical protein